MLTICAVRALDIKTVAEFRCILQNLSQQRLNAESKRNKSSSQSETVASQTNINRRAGGMQNYNHQRATHDTLKQIGKRRSGSESVLDEQNQHLPSRAFDRFLID
jgi:oligoendopeptidase F